MKYHIISFLLFFFYVPVLHGMNNRKIHDLNKSVHLVVIPGQNGVGGGNVKSVLPQFKNIHYVSTPESLPDLGQGQCIKYLKNTISTLIENQDVDQIIIHASSQGTATALNYVSEQPKKVKMLILEAVLASGNSAIFHTVDKMIMPSATALPLSYYWLPYLAKFTMPLYSPTGQQAIFNIQNLPQDLPIIILHSIYDPQLSFDDAMALYAGLKSNGHNAVYLFPIEAYGHVLLLGQNNHKEISAIHNILKHHGLLIHDASKSNKSNDFKEYQPEPDLAVYTELIRKEKVLSSVDLCLKIMIVGILLGACNSLLGY